MADSASSRTGNLLLDAFSSYVRDRLLAASHVRSLEPGELLARVDDEVNEAYFPTSGSLSILAEPDEHTIDEASTVGREGAADIFAALGALTSAHRLIGQVPGDVVVIDVKVIRDEVAAARTDADPRLQLHPRPCTRRPRSAPGATRSTTSSSARRVGSCRRTIVSTATRSSSSRSSSRSCLARPGRRCP
jgi:CRP-like cAMP-binding protein